MVGKYLLDLKIGWMGLEPLLGVVCMLYLAFTRCVAVQSSSTLRAASNAVLHQLRHFREHPIHTSTEIVSGHLDLTNDQRAWKRVSF
jgi:hypothetical protein